MIARLSPALGGCALLLLVASADNLAQDAPFAAVEETCLPTRVLTVVDVNRGDHDSAAFTDARIQRAWHDIDIVATGRTSATGFRMPWGDAGTDNTGRHAVAGPAAAIGAEIRRDSDEITGLHSPTMGSDLVPLAACTDTWRSWYRPAAQ